jgi:transcriptional regulator with XRE-family HTH domain
MDHGVPASYGLMPKQKTVVNEAVGRAIREARKQRGYSQEAFALAAGLDRSYMGAVERGEFNLTLETLLKIAGALGTSAAEMLALAGL